MGEVINLNKYRKKKAREEREKRAEQNRLKRGLSPAELAIKLDCLYHHRSQRSQTPFTETQAGEDWQQAEQINRTTAKQYDRLGLAEYEAIESFHRLKNVNVINEAKKR